VPAKPVYVIELVHLPAVEEIEIQKPAPPSEAEPKARKIAAPKMLAQRDIFETAAPAPSGTSRKELKEPKTLIEHPYRLALLPSEPGSIRGGWNTGEHPGEAEGAASSVGSLFDEGDAEILDGSGLSGGGGGNGIVGLGRGAKGDGTGGGGASAGDVLSGFARPLGGYQVKPRYPESARQAGAEGVTLLKLRILENGKVGQVLIEESAGHPDLDIAASEAVKKWRFEPARQGKNRVAVWMLLPIKFELN
jgi:TonB family protein